MSKSDSQVLVINSGSSSLKLSVFSIDKENCDLLIDCELSQLHTEHPKLQIGEASSVVQGPKSIKESISIIWTEISKQEINRGSITAIGHRVVHGGAFYIKSTLIDDTVIDNLEKISYLAPLHNPACMEGILACKEIFGPIIPQLAVFDTAFHNTLPLVASLYAIPRNLSEKYPIKRYGFHGIAHAALWDSYTQYIGKPHSNSKIITLQLGNGCSMTAIKGGVSLETSMGFTPTEGLIMGTRSGDTDPTLMEFLCEQEGKSPKEIGDILNKASGLLGVSGISSNMKDLIDLYPKNSDAKLTVDMFCYRIIKYLGSYLAVLKGVDGVLFSGGIGENNSLIRQKVIEAFEWHGVKIDCEANEHKEKLSAGKLRKISSPDSKVEIFIAAANENSAIAKEIMSILKI